MNATKQISTQKQLASAAQVKTCMWKYIFFVIVFFSFMVGAETTEEMQGSAAGRYYGAIVLASEFSKTSCGKTANLSDQITNTSIAVKEIRDRFTKAKSGDADKFFTKSEELKQRQEMRDLLGSMKLDKCDLAKQTLIPFIEKEVKNWKSFR
jgi:hypothetical protein